MKLFIKLDLLFVLLLPALLIPQWAQAEPPQSIHYQAYLKNNAGLPVNGSQSITFRLYDAATAGSLLWSETKTVAVSNGATALLF